MLSKNGQSLTPQPRQTAQLGMFSQGFLFQEPTNIIREGTKNVSAAYCAWVDKHVVLLIKVRQTFVPKPFSIIDEIDAGVRVCIHPG
jgi:hypothetical protein